MMSKNDLKVALIHDELIRRGGAERVFEELIRIYPQADVFSLYAGNDARITINEKTYPIHTSFLQKFPIWFRRHPGRLLPFLPFGAEQFDFSQYDVVISSSSAFAKNIVTRSTVPHICYCHTPTRYLWDTTHEVSRRAHGLKGWLLKLTLHNLRLVDFAAAQRPDIMLANSEYTQERISSYYRRESSIIYPPIDTAFFTPGGSEKSILLSHRPFLLVGRLTPSKHFEQAIAVCEKLQLPLAVVGIGSEMKKLQAMAGKHTRFLGKVLPHQLRKLYREGRALLQPGVEDFGMATAEALACGTPVIAFGEGGVKEIVSSKHLGVLYKTQKAESLAEAIRQFLLVEKSFTASELQRQALTFSRHRFQAAIREQVEQTLRKGAQTP